MVDALLNMRSHDDFLAVSSRFFDASWRSDFVSQIQEKGIVLLKEDLWPHDKLEKFTGDMSFNAVIKMTESDGDSARIVHRLQLIGQCNPGLKKRISRWLDVLCV